MASVTTMNDENNLLDKIEETDLPFELKLLENVSDETVWDNYINHKKLHIETSEIDSKIRYEEQLLALLYRKSWALISDFSVWCEFIDYYVEFVGHFSFNPTELNKIDLCFNYNEERWGTKVEFWVKRLEFLLKYKDHIDASQILALVDRSFEKLKYSDHLEIWNVVLLKIMLINGIPTSLQFRVYFSYMIYIKNQIKFGLLEDYDRLKKSMDLDTAFEKLLSLTENIADLERFHKLFLQLTESNILINFTVSELELNLKYFQRLANLARMESNCLNFTSQIYESIIQKFPDQQSTFTIKYANLLIGIDDFKKGIQLLEDHMNKSLTVKDFSLLFDSLTAQLEKRIEYTSENNMTDELSNLVDRLEYLLGARKLLLNDVKLRQNINSPVAWLERLKILGDDESKITELLDCYAKAVLSIVTKKIPQDERHIFAQIWCNYAKLYFKKGDLQNCRSLFETATKVPWTEMEQLETIWIEWIKCEIATGDLERATHVASLSIMIPQQVMNGKVDIKDESVSVHMKLFKSLRLWCLFLDLVENTKDFDAVCKSYDDAFELKVVNSVIATNYCFYLEEKGFYEKCFSILERALNIFAGNSKDVIFTIYMNKVLKYWSDLEWDKERVREVFEKGIDHFSRRRDTEKLRDAYVLYAHWEFEHGSRMRSLKVLREGIDVSQRQEDKLTLYKILIVNTIEVKNLEWAVDVFIDAIDELSVQLPGYIETIISSFVNTEVALKNIGKAREVLRYASENIMEFNKNDSDRALIWDLFKKFELEHGDESSYKDMLKKKQYLENMYGAIKMTPNTPSEIETQLRDEIGFVKSSTGPKTTTYTVEEEIKETGESKKNGDDNEIELEIDLAEL
ncbi:hypothetical protein CANINC_003573 [Pichia inconspicua]|uniref:Pre-mRNA-splicing factor SYF1 n=1 Tax=Pichia inconspicua TaxID=52247 RepID=A0A4T0WYE4_9ASCO|nr:hypothetical protein CANINC_003573 [[Candida] inconspicua]